MNVSGISLLALMNPPKEYREKSYDKIWVGVLYDSEQNTARVITISSGNYMAAKEETKRYVGDKIFFVIGTHQSAGKAAEIITKCLVEYKVPQEDFNKILQAVGLTFTEAIKSDDFIQTQIL